MSANNALPYTRNSLWGRIMKGYFGDDWRLEGDWNIKRCPFVTLYSMLSHEEKAGMQVPPDDVILSRRRHLLDYRVTSANSLINVLFSRYLWESPLFVGLFSLSSKPGGIDRPQMPTT